MSRFGRKKKNNQSATAEAEQSIDWNAQAVEYGLDVPGDNNQSQMLASKAAPRRRKKKCDPWAIVTMTIVVIVASFLGFVAFRQNTTDEPVFALFENIFPKSSDDGANGNTQPRGDATGTTNIAPPPTSEESESGTTSYGTNGSPQTLGSTTIAGNETSSTTSIPMPSSTESEIPESSSEIFDVVNKTMEQTQASFGNDAATSSPPDANDAAAPSPTDTSDIVSPFSNSNCDDVVCPEGKITCPNGNLMGRDPCQQCMFYPCEEEEEDESGESETNKNEKENLTLVAQMGRYPDSNVETNPEGEVIMVFVENGDIVIELLNLVGVGDECTGENEDAVAEEGCVIQVFYGKSCQDSNSIGNPWWNGELFESNPWVNVTYSSDSLRAVLMTDGNGYGFRTNKGHAVGIHDVSGNRVACGILEEGLSSLPENGDGVTPPNCDLMCIQDVFDCGDGFYAGRDPCNNCEYRPCDSRGREGVSGGNDRGLRGRILLS